MLFKALVVILFIANIVALAAALRSLFKDQTEERTGNTAKMLTIRVALAVSLLVVVIIGLAVGELAPSGVPWLYTTS